jgi:hypothetical protein
MQALLEGALESGELQVRGGRLVRHGQAVMPRLSFEKSTAGLSEPRAGVRLSAAPPVDDHEDEPQVRPTGSEPKMAIDFMPPPPDQLVVSRAHQERHQPA